MSNESSPQAQPPLTRPAWRRATAGERRWWVGLGALLAIVLQGLLPDRFAIHPRYLLQGAELLALIALIAVHPERMSRRSAGLRLYGQVFIGVIAAVNAVSVILLLHQLTTGGHIPAVQLLVGGGEIWFTNVIVFALWYWELDRGGPANRALGSAAIPDLLFPQMTDAEFSAEWEPEFFDYLYVSFTNSTAFSPTDTMPLSRWVKLLFLLQSAISLITVALIAARAVNILPNA